MWGARGGAVSAGSACPFAGKWVTSRSAQPSRDRGDRTLCNGDSMKLSMERSALLRAMSRAQSVVERRNTIPILANVLIEAEGDQVSFRATDLDIEVIDRAPAMVSRAGATTVAAHTLHEIARKLPDGAMVELTDDGIAGPARRRAPGGRTSASQTLPREDFPIMASAEYQVELRLPGAGAAPAVRQGEVRDLDRGDALLSERRLHARRQGRRTARCCAASRPTATGWRGSTRRCPRAPRTCPGVIVPRKTVGELRKLLDDDEMTIAVSVSETKVRFATPEVTLTSKVIDGTFPDYARVIPTGNTKRLEVDAAEFAQAVDRVATVSSERSRAVKMALEDDRLVLSVNAPDSAAPPTRSSPSPTATSGWRSASTPSTCWRSPARWTARTRSSCSTPPATRR